MSQGRGKQSCDTVHNQTTNGTSQSTVTVNRICFEVRDSRLLAKGFGPQERGPHQGRGEGTRGDGTEPDPCRKQSDMAWARWRLCPSSHPAGRVGPRHRVGAHPRNRPAPNIPNTPAGPHPIPGPPKPHTLEPITTPITLARMGVLQPAPSL